MAVRRLLAVLFHLWQGVTLESKSTSSHVLPGLNPDWRACQQRGTKHLSRKKNPTVGQNLHRSCALPLSKSAICCFVLFSFRWGPIMGVRDGWTAWWRFVIVCPISRIQRWSAWRSWVCLFHQYRRSRYRQKTGRKKRIKGVWVLGRPTRFFSFSVE